MKTKISFVGDIVAQERVPTLMIAAAAMGGPYFVYDRMKRRPSDAKWTAVRYTVRRSEDAPELANKRSVRIIYAHHLRQNHLRTHHFYF